MTTIHLIRGGDLNQHQLEQFPTHFSQNVCYRASHSATRHHVPSIKTLPPSAFSPPSPPNPLPRPLTMSYPSYPLTFISPASPPIRNSHLLPSSPTHVLSSTTATTPFMIAAPKRRGRPAKHPTSTVPPLQTRSRRSAVSQPTADGIISHHQQHINAEQAALAVLEQNPHLLADDHSSLTNPDISLDISPTTASLPKAKRKRPGPIRQPNSPRPNGKQNSPRPPTAHHIATPPAISSSDDTPQSLPLQSSPSLNSEKSQPKSEPSKTDPSESKKEPAWSSASSTDNTVRWYLQLIGGDRLLRPEEEVELGRQIRDLMSWQRKLVQLADTIGREPTVDEWAQFLGEDPDEFKKKLFEARRAKDRMVVCNLRLVVSIAKRYLNRGMPLSDLIQEGTLGLIRACEKFDAEKGFKFSTYATWWVRQAVSRSIADQSRTIRLPVHLYDTITAIRRATKYLTNELGRPPLEQEIADYCNITVEKLRATRVNMQAAMPLDCPLSATDDGLTLSDIIESDEESPEDRVESSLLRDDLEHVVNSLTPRERDVVRMRYGLDDGRAKTLEEIGRVFDVTKERVRQIESKALRKLRHPYRSAVLREYTPPEL